MQPRVYGFQWGNIQAVKAMPAPAGFVYQVSVSQEAEVF
jgi:hypothetical protein